MKTAFGIAIVILASAVLGIVLPSMLNGNPPGGSQGPGSSQATFVARPSVTPTSSPSASADSVTVSSTVTMTAGTPMPVATPSPRPSRTPTSTAQASPTRPNTRTPTPTRTRTLTATTIPSHTPQPAATPLPTATPIPTATATPAFDYVVVSLREIPVAGTRDTALIRGRLVDLNGQLVSGTRFNIVSDGVPQWSATEPPSQRADGTVEFSVTRGGFTVRVDGGRSQDTGLLLTGRTGQDQLSDWEIVFQTTR